MSISSVTTKILSSLGNNTGSIIPIATKDLIQNQIIVAQYAKEGGEHDAFERFIEENGTSAIWLGGLPLFKKIIDKTIYKAANISPDVDIKKLKEGSADSVQLTLKRLEKLGKKGSDQYMELLNVSKNMGKTKGLFVGKFAAATALSILALAGIILFKQKDTEAKIKNKVALEVAEQMALRNSVNSSKVTEMFNEKIGKKTDSSNKNTIPSFKGLGSALSAFMYNPVLNQSLLDVGITSIRTATARDGERRDVLVKEAFEIGFLYFLAEPIQKAMDKLFGGLFKKDTSFDYGTLASDRFEKNLSNNSLQKALKKFFKDFDIEKIGKDNDVDKKLIDFIYENPKNAVVKFLKDTGDVSTIKGTDEIDALSYIDTKTIKKNLSKLSKVVEKLDTLGVSEDKVKNYLKGARKAKGFAIVSAIALGIWSISVLQTKIVLKLRKDKNGTTENEAIVNLENKLRHQMAFNGTTPKIQESLKLQ